MNTNTSTAMIKQPSPQQEAYFSWINTAVGSAVLEAVAGAGKTTTLIHGLSLMSGRVFFGAFNKKIVLEIREKCNQLQHVTVNTMHAEGFGAVRRAFKGIQVNNDKCRDIFRGASEKYPAYKPFESVVLQLTSLAKQAAVGITKDADDRGVWMDIIEHFDIETFTEENGEILGDNTDLIIKLARKVLQRSNETCHVEVDFDDMIYAPLYHKVKFFQYDWVLIDEAQDTNETRRLLALAILKKGGRLVAVGDRHQAIYGFTGADANSLDLIAESVNATRLPLTTTYRCPKSVVSYAQQWVSHIQCAETAPDGVVMNGAIEDLSKIAKPGDAILCRFNAPLVTHVYAFIAEGIPALIEGRDIGSGLQTLARRWKRIATYSKLLDKLCEYEARETKKYRIKEQESKAVAVEDKVNCLRVIISRAEKVDPSPENVVDRVCREIDSIFTEDKDAKREVVLFSSIHKSKGREWSKVVWLQTGPSGYAHKDWEQEQEINLCYVAATRAKKELVLVDINAKKD